MFTNLAQYNPGTYYLTIPEIKSKSGIPSNATIIAANIREWKDLGDIVNVGINTTGGIYVLYTPGHNISSTSSITVQIAYIV